MSENHSRLRQSCDWCPKSRLTTSKTWWILTNAYAQAAVGHSAGVGGGRYAGRTFATAVNAVATPRLTPPVSRLNARLQDCWTNALVIQAYVRLRQHVQWMRKGGEA